MRYLLLVSRLLLLGLAVGFCCLSVMLWHVPYDKWVLYIVEQSGKPHLLPLLRERFFTPQKFIIARYALSLISLLYGIFVPWVWHRLPTCGQYLSAVVADLRHLWAWWAYSFRFIPPYLKKLLGLAGILFIAKTLYYIQFPIQYDEAWSYNYFTDNSLVLSVAAYNNHPLLMLISHLFKWLPFEMLINLRLPVLIVGIWSVLLLFALLRRLFEVESAVVGTVFFAFCCPITFYMLYARGYIFTVFFTLLLLVNALVVPSQTTNSPPPTKYRIRGSTAIFIALGLYSMPTFAYCIIPFVAYCSVRSLYYAIPKTINFVLGDKGHNKANVPAFSAETRHTLDVPNTPTILAGIILAILFYLPMLLGTGIDLGIGVAIDTLPYSQLVQQTARYILLVGYFLSGIAIHYFHIAVVAFLMVWAVRRLTKTAQRHVTVLSALSLLLPLVVWCLQRVWVPERIWTFLVVYASIVVSALSYSGLGYITQRQYRYIFISILSIIAIVGQSWLVFRHDFVNWSYQRDLDCRHIAELMLQQSIADYYTNFDYGKPIIEYYYRLSHRYIEARSADPNSASYAPFEPQSTRYSAVISNKEAATPIGILSDSYCLVFENDEVEVWLLSVP